MFVDNFCNHYLIGSCVRFEGSFAGVPMYTLKGIVSPIVFLFEVGYEFLSMESG